MKLPDNFDYRQIALLKDAVDIKMEEIGGSDWRTKLNDSENKEINSKIKMMMHEYFKSKLGFILYDGTNTGEIVLYNRTGLEHRWDWGSKNNSYSFVIKTDGTGLYYDFSTADDDGRKSKADDIYKCRK